MTKTTAVQAGQWMVIVGRSSSGGVVADRGDLVSVHDTQEEAEESVSGSVRAGICAPGTLVTACAGADRTPRGAEVA